MHLTSLTLSSFVTGIRGPIMAQTGHMIAGVNIEFARLWDLDRALTISQYMEESIPQHVLLSFISEQNA